MDSPGIFDSEAAAQRLRSKLWKSGLGNCRAARSGLKWPRKQGDLVGKLQRGGTTQIHRSVDFTGMEQFLVWRSAELQRPGRITTSDVTCKNPPLHIFTSRK